MSCCQLSTLAMLLLWCKCRNHQKKRCQLIDQSKVANFVDFECFQFPALHPNNNYWFLCLLPSRNLEFNLLLPSSHYLRTFHTLREMWFEFHQPFRESYIYCNCKRKMFSTNNELKQPQEVFPRPSSNASMLHFYMASRKPTFRSVLDAIVFFVEFLTGV